MIFKVEVNLKFREDSYLYVEDEVAISIEGTFISGPVRLQPLDPTKSGIKVSFNVKSENLEEAKRMAKEFIEKMALILCCKTNVGVKIEDFNLIELPRASATGLDVLETLTIKDKVSIGLGLSKVSFEEIFKIIKNNILQLEWRFLDWYNRALLERDPVNRFLMLWTAVEVLKTHVLGRSESKHREKLREIFKKYGFEENFDEIYECRNDLFHEGEKENAVKYLHSLESLANRIMEEIRDRHPI